MAEQIYDKEALDNKLDNTRDQLDQLMDNQMQQMDTIFKKAMVQSVIWSIISLIIYFIWPDNWYFWIPTVIAAIMAGAFIFVAVFRKKLKSKLAGR